MSAIAGFFRGLDDRVNPIVVKELRQSVRSRLVVILFVMFLIALLVVSWITIASMASRLLDGGGVGAELAGVLTVVLWLATAFGVPIYAGVRLMAERSSAGQMDLMYATTIRPWAIVRGKLVGAVALIVLLYSAAAPFLTLTYLLRGIDLVEMFTRTGLLFLHALVAVQIALLFASIPGNLPMRILAGIAGLGAIVAWGSMVGLMEIASIGRPFMPFPTWWFYLTMALFMLLLFGLLHVLTVALISPASSNRMLPVRAYLTGTWLATLGIAIAWWQSTGNDDSMQAWSAISAWVLPFYLLLAVSERRTWGIRIRRKIPRNPLLRLLAFPFFTGATGGVLWAMALTVISVGVSLWSTSNDDMLSIVLGLPLFVFAYSISGYFLFQIIFGKRAVSASYTFVMVLGLFVVLAVLPMLLLLIISLSTHYYRIEDSPLLFANPFALVDRDGREAQLVFAGLWAVVVAVPWLVETIRRFAQFRPLAVESRPAARLAPLPEAAAPEPPSESPTGEA